MWKAIVSFIFSSLAFLGIIDKPLYIAPPLPATTTQVTIATTTKPIATTTIVKKNSASTTTQTKTVATKKVEVAISTPKIETVVVKSEPVPDFEAINTFARGTIVNILCTVKGNELSPISGTGVVVSKSGLILTNAHLAQYFLLKDYAGKNSLDCVARTGSPAYPKYNLELVYISPTWVEKNKTLLKEQNPMGTGENDFAFVRITGMVDGSKLPESFTYLSMNIRENIISKEPVLLVSYPAGFLGGISVLQDLSITSAITLTDTLYTFKDGSVDLISVPGTVVSQKGSSGGAVVDKYASLLGIIVTTSSGEKTSDRDLQAITLAYINRSLQNEIGLNLEQFTNQNMSEVAKKFQEINAPNLTKLITDELNK